MNDDDGELIPLGAVLEALDGVREEKRGIIAKKAEREVRRGVPMYVSEAERAVLACVLIDGSDAIEKLEDTGLRPSDFYNNDHGAVYEAMVSLWERKREVSIITIADELNRRAKHDGMLAYLSQLQASLPTGVGASVHANIVIEKARLRSVSTVCAEVVGRARSGEGSFDLIDYAQEKINGINVTRGGETFADLRRVVRDACDKLPVNGYVDPGISTGFHDVDAIFKAAPGDLVVVAARPSMGKTQFVCDCAKHVCIRNGMPVAFFSLEMTAEQLTNRFLGSMSKLDLKRKEMPPHEVSELAGYAATLADAQLDIDEQPGLTIGDIRARARRANRKHKLGLIVVDYIQLVEPARPMESKATEIAEVSKGLKRLARELQCPVIALSQLNRGVESRQNKRPMMSDLRESGAIEQDADVIAFLYRDEYYAKDRTPPELVGVAEVIVDKNRNGATGVAKIRFNKAPPRFETLASEW